MPGPCCRATRLCLFLEGDDCLPDSERLQQSRFSEKGKELGPTATCGEMPSVRGRDNRVAVGHKHPFQDLGESCANVFGERAIDCYAGHAVSRMSESLEIGLGFTHALEGCRVAGLHVDRDDFPRIIAHPVPQPSVPVLHASFLDVYEETGWGWLPDVLLFRHNAGRVVLAEGYASELGVAEFGAGCLEPLMGLLGPEGASVLEHELVDRELPFLASEEPDCQWIAAGRLMDSLPDVALIVSDFPDLGELKVFRPSVAIVTDEFYAYSA